MKIVFLDDGIYKYATGAISAVGGAERQQWLLARALATSNWSVTVGVCEGLELGNRRSVDGVEFTGIGRGRGHILSAWYRFLTLEQPDWWYWRCASHLLGPAFAVAKLAGVRTIFSVAFDRDVDIRHALFMRPRWWPLYALGLWWTDRIFVQNQYQLSSIPRWLRAKTCIVPSITTATQTVKPHSLRMKYVAWVAMLRQFKRPDLLIEIARKAPDIRFEVCGGPTTFAAAPGYGEAIADTLRALPNVMYRGQVAPEEAQRVIANAALFLSTSDVEGFPNTFLQAWAAGTPVVSLSIDPDYVIERGQLGSVCSDVKTALSTIRTLIHSPDDRERIAIRARQYIGEHHSEALVTAVFNGQFGD